jgi:outer membrane protein
MRARLVACVMLMATTSRAQTSLTLSEVVSTARSRAADPKEARAQAEAADALADAALGGYLPSLDARLSANRAWTHSYQPDATTGTLTGTPAASVGTNVGGVLSWTAWDFGRTSSAVGAARADSRGSIARAHASENEAARSAASLFLTAVFDEELVKVAQTTLALREKHANLSKGLVLAGMRPPVEEARARVELALARLDVTAAERQLAQDRVRLATVLMMDPNRDLHLVKPAVLPTVATNAHHAAEDAERRRPEVGAANESVAASEELYDAAKAARYPKIGFALDASHVTTKSDDDNRWFPTRGLTGMVTLTVPLFDWSVWGRVPAARANVSAAEARASGVRARVRGQAAEASYAVQGARALVDQAKAARELAAATLAVMEARYAAGLASPFDLFDAAKKDGEARTATIRAELLLATATVDALAATGRIEELAR